jgi:hypothetical protein
LHPIASRLKSTRGSVKVDWPACEALAPRSPGSPDPDPREGLQNEDAGARCETPALGPTDPAKDRPAAGGESAAASLDPWPAAAPQLAAVGALPIDPLAARVAPPDDSAAEAGAGSVESSAAACETGHDAAALPEALEAGDDRARAPARARSAARPANSQRKNARGDDELPSTVQAALAALAADVTAGVAAGVQQQVASAGRTGGRSVRGSDSGLISARHRMMRCEGVGQDDEILGGRTG